MSVFVFGNASLRDKPDRVIVRLKRGSPREYTIDNDYGMLFNPGEPLTYVHTFHAPGEIVTPGVTSDTTRHIRVLEILSWDVVESVEFHYPSLEETDPSVWLKPTPPPPGVGRAPGNPLNH